MMIKNNSLNAGKFNKKKRLESAKPKVWGNHLGSMKTSKEISISDKNQNMSNFAKSMGTGSMYYNN